MQRVLLRIYLPQEKLYQEQIEKQNENFIITLYLFVSFGFTAQQHNLDLAPKHRALQT
jgi:hypothetical protein